MHVCLCMITGMTAELGPGPFELTDELIAERAAANRALTLKRLEDIWKVVEGHLDPDLGADPRWAEIGLRVIDREAKLLRLDRPAAVEEDDGLGGSGVDLGTLVLAQLSALEQSLNVDKPPADPAV